MEFIDVSGKTVDDAISNACEKLGITSDQLEYEVIEKGSAGLFGIGSKPAVIKAAKKVFEEEVVVEEVIEVSVETESRPADALTEKEFSVEDEVRDFLEKVFDAMDMEVEILISVDEESRSVDVELKGDNMGVLIGKRGQTLDSLQYLANLALNKNSDEYYRVKVDTEDYRNRRKETLENLAKNIAYKVKRSRKSIELEPMNPFERRIIHSALQGDKYVTTHSEGEEPYRHVVVTLKR